jgi:hypothetical protein
MDMQVNVKDLTLKELSIRSEELNHDTWNGVYKNNLEKAQKKLLAELMIQEIRDRALFKPGNVIEYENIFGTRFGVILGIDDDGKIMFEMSSTDNKTGWLSADGRVFNNEEIIAKKISHESLGRTVYFYDPLEDDKEKIGFIIRSNSKHIDVYFPEERETCKHETFYVNQEDRDFCRLSDKHLKFKRRES